jgi:cellulose synthase/poly-beta-1,6-N-acetylglucosamine synthase-like glycosyltransferase
VARVLDPIQVPLDSLYIGSLGVSGSLGRVTGIVLSCLQVIVAIGLGYYYLLLAASLLRRRTSGSHPLPTRTFAIVIPAHNEGAVLAKTIRFLRAQNYPSDLFDIYVAADHCDDHTAQVARENGAICYERSEEPRGRKGYALQWLLKRIIASKKDYDAIVIFDADSQVDPSFLAAMNRALIQGHTVLQGKHVIARPRGNRFSGLAAVDMRLNNLLFNQARHNLGLSCRLMGDAMCLAIGVIRQHGWPAESFGEDREYGLYLLTQGIRIAYVPEAVSFGQAAPGWKDASAQRLRWYRGVFQIRKKFALKLLRSGVEGWNWAAFEQAIALLLPSFSTLVSLSILVVGLQWAWGSLGLLLPQPVSIGFVLAWALLPFLGLWADRAPASAYRALLYGPLYLLWRLWIGFQARIQGRRVRWIRTKRCEEVGLPTPEV